ncbi:hypothetical protein [Streptomyces sp. NBC_01538]|uniref:hypothetical protein n=1 Tax=Streptomyces sp. NBC_01538 TaxID=2903897 RepID=UPI0038704BC0
MADGGGGTAVAGRRWRDGGGGTAVAPTGESVVGVVAVLASLFLPPVFLVAAPVLAGARRRARLRGQGGSADGAVGRLGGGRGVRRERLRGR